MNLCIIWRNNKMLEREETVEQSRIWRLKVFKPSDLEKFTKGISEIGVAKGKIVKIQIEC